jgi:hypothetical protein
MQFAPQTVDELQNAAGFRFHDRLHHQLATAIQNGNHDRFLVHIHADILDIATHSVASLGERSFASTESFPRGKVPFFRRFSYIFLLALTSPHCYGPLSHNALTPDRGSECNRLLTSAITPYRKARCASRNRTRRGPPYILEDDAFGEETVGIHCVRENAESGLARMSEINGTIWLFAISLLMLVAVLAFAILTGFAPYGSPAEVIKAFYSACNSGSYSVAERLLVPEANRVLTRHIGAVDGGLRAICDEETKQGHLQKVRGELAQVRYMLYYADGSAIEESQGLVVKHWVWKIAP